LKLYEADIQLTKRTTVRVKVGPMHYDGNACVTIATRT